MKFRYDYCYCQLVAIPPITTEGEAANRDTLPLQATSIPQYQNALQK